MLGTRSDVRGFVSEVTARYGSLEEFFAQLRAEVERPDDEVTVQLPVVERGPGPVAWSAADSVPACPGGRPVPDRTEDVTTRWGAADPGGRSRNGMAAVWDRLTGRG